MVHTRGFVAAIAVLSITAVAAPAPIFAQNAPAAPATSKKLTREKLSEMRAKWKANKPKLKACWAEVRKKGLAGDDRWFFIEDCMGKT